MSQSLLNEFDNAKAKISSLKTDPEINTKLKLYGLFKQATIGRCKTPKPGVTSIEGRAKWNAWNSLGEMSKDEALKSYINYVAEITGSVNSQRAIITSIEFNNILMIRLNRPKKFNALNSEMYNEIAKTLKEADSNSDVIACCITGNGPYFSSGNDLNNYTGTMEGDAEENIKTGCDMCGKFVQSFIDFSKPLIAIVNGPAIGISFTVLGLFDMVITSDRAKFSAPFTQKALSPEGCSSYTFPKLMGRIKAMDVLIFNKTLTANEAFNSGLITEIIPHDDLYKKSMNRLEQISKLPKESLLDSRNFIRRMDKANLSKINQMEMEMLANRLSSGEFMESVIEFMSKRSKL